MYECIYIKDDFHYFIIIINIINLSLFLLSLYYYTSENVIE